MDLDNTLQRLAPRWFVVRDAHASSVSVLLHPRHTMTLMRGPMTRRERREARRLRAAPSKEAQPAQHQPGRLPQIAAAE